MARLDGLIYLFIPSVILLHLFVSPYTKVEESFNIQAIHDILIHGIPTENASQFFSSNYDHVSFPGSVPRTFVGALILSGFSRPFVGLLKRTDQLQLLVRAILGLSNALALISFARSVRRAFGPSAGIWYVLLQASQFHVIYYASRTLPNMFAFAFSTLALKCLLNACTPGSYATVPRSYRLCLFLLTFSGVVFRSELAILVGTITLYSFATKRISITRIIIPAGVSGLIIGLLCTVSVDSFFWQSFPLWPEWIAFYFNTIQGHSADWGVSPWHFYFFNSLPRLLMNPMFLICIPLAVRTLASRQRSLDLLVPLLSFIGLYSILPHKEWRFILYAIPGLTGVTAVGASWIWTRRAKSVTYAILSLALVGSVLFSFAASTALLTISSLNYPGGAAFQYLHQHVNATHERNHRVYLDNLACQTGVTRFLENHDGPQSVTDVLEAQSIKDQSLWTYDKTEDPSALLDPQFWTQFDYVLAERPEKVIGSWRVVHVTYGFSGIRVLKPGEDNSVSSLENGDSDIWKEPAGQEFTTKVAKAWRMLEGTVRNRILRGWWVEIKMEPKIRILEKEHLASD